MILSPDEIVYATIGPFDISATLVFTWVVMALLVVGSALITRSLRVHSPLARGQNVLEALVVVILDQIATSPSRIRGRTCRSSAPCSCSSSRRTCWASCPGSNRRPARCRPPRRWPYRVFLAVPLFGIASRACAPTCAVPAADPVMLPFTIIGELSRTLALAVRLFGNVMSGTVIVAHAAGGRAALLPRRDAGVRPADRRDPGVHLRDPGDRLHRLRRPPRPPASANARRRREHHERHRYHRPGLHFHRRPDHRDRLDRPGARPGEGLWPRRSRAIAQQPDETNAITRTLFVGLAMIESTAIYCFVVALILVFANPFWGAVTGG
jgi:F-type H+-transporting ATPase subunit a